MERERGSVVNGLAGVTARIASIEARFAPPAGFSGALAQAGGDRPAGGDATASSPAPPPTVLPPSLPALTLGQVAPTTVLGGTPATGLTAGAAAATGVSGGPVAAATMQAAGAGSPAWAARLPAAGQRWAGAIDAAAQSAGVDPRLLAALTWQESGFKADARSHAGATGLTQLMPATARGLGVDPMDPVANLEGGARYLRQQLDRFGSVDLALAAYNAGPGRVARAGGVPNIRETQNYVRRVTDYYSQLR